MKALKQPATIIAMLALFVALGGTAAIAGGLISGKKIVNHSIAEKKLTNAAIAALKGQKGDPGPAGSARAWAKVGQTGSLDLGVHVGSVTHQGTGDYCVELDSSINRANAVAILTPYYPNDFSSSGTPGRTTDVEWDATCGTNGLEVVTFAVTNGSSVTQHDEPFAIAVP